MILIRRLSASGFKQLGEVDLHLPRRGRFLVRGLNEAGKSTLFEAIYFALFGRPLTTETGHARLDDVIRYGEDEALVSLDVELAGGGAEQVLRMRRAVRRGRPNSWELDVVGGDGAVEEVRGNRVVNERIEAELGFDGDALLNTCFVEQKKLEKLEGMSRAQREQSLMRLFNLDRLLEIGDELKVRHADESALERLARRAELADLQSKVPDLRAAHGELSTTLEQARVRDNLREMSARLGGIEESREDLRAAAADADRLRGRATDAARALAAATALREARTARDRALGARADAERLGSDLRVAHEAQAEEPRIVARGLAIGRLKRRHACVLALERERQELAASVSDTDLRLEQLARDREGLNDVRRDLVQARAAGQDADSAKEALTGDGRAFDVRDAIRELLAAQTAQSMPDDTTARDGATSEREAATRRRLIEASATAVLAALLLVGSYWLWPLLVGCIALLAVLAWRWLAASRRIDALTAELGRLEGEASASDRDRLRQAAREEEARQRLRELNSIAPSTPERAQEALVQLEDRLGDRTRGDVARAITEAQAAGEGAAAQTAALSERESELARRCGRIDGAALGRQRDAQAVRVERIDRFLGRREPLLDRQSLQLGAARDVATLEQELGALRLALTTARDAARRAPDVEREAAEAQRAAEAHWSDAEAAWGAAADQALGPWSPDSDDADRDAAADQAPGPQSRDTADAVWDAAADQALGPWSRDTADADWDAAAKHLSDAFEAAGGGTVRAAAEAAATRADNLAGRLAATEKAFATDLDLLRVRLAASAVEGGPGATDGSEAVDDSAPQDGSGAARARDVAALVPDAPARGDLDAAAERIASRVPEIEPELAARTDAALAELTTTIGVADRLARELGLEGERLDAEAAAKERDRAEHDLAVRRRAAEIVGLAGRNVMRRVLPQTIEHMRGLLPRLTEGRYFDVQLSDDYRIEVYDERARGWKKKSIFSGGARDQMSLTLRLAFALATLPEERGARPGFLFLDEPLGAFDDQRAAALIGLLTDGEIADSFDQVFLISHVRVDESLFDFRITMADGQVTDSNLPEPSG